MDNLDIRREANKAALKLSTNSGAPINAVRSMQISSIKAAYYYAILDGVPRGFQKDWIIGWRRGYGNVC